MAFNCEKICRLDLLLSFRTKWQQKLQHVRTILRILSLLYTEQRQRAHVLPGQDRLPQGVQVYPKAAQEKGVGVA